MSKIPQVNKKTIGFDLDDTIRDHSVNRRRLNKKLGLPPDKTEFKKILYGQMSLTCRPMSGSLIVIKKLLNLGHKIIIVSRNKVDGRIFARQWLNKYLPGISARRIYFVDDNKTKNLICQKEKAQIFVDDKPAVLKSLDKPIVKILFDPQKEFESKKYLCVSSWREIEKLIRSSQD